MLYDKRGRGARETVRYLGVAARTKGGRPNRSASLELARASPQEVTGGRMHARSKHARTTRAHGVSFVKMRFGAISRSFAFHVDVF